MKRASATPTVVDVQGRRLAALVVLAAVVSAPAPGPAATARAVFACPGAGSTVGLLSEVIRKERLDERP